jgi:CRP-like cAMP-binding protein
VKAVAAFPRVPHLWRVLGINFVGEMRRSGDAAPRTGTVTTTSPTTVLVLTNRAFDRPPTELPSAQTNLMKELVERFHVDSL